MYHLHFHTKIVLFTIYNHQLKYIPLKALVAQWVHPFIRHSLIVLDLLYNPHCSTVQRSLIFYTLFSMMIAIYFFKEDFIQSTPSYIDLPDTPLLVPKVCLTADPTCVVVAPGCLHTWTMRGKHWSGLPISRPINC